MTDSAPERLVALVSQAPALIAGTGDAVAAAGLALRVCQEPGDPALAQARAVLVGVDAVPGLARSGLPRQSEAIVVGEDGAQRGLWQAAGELSAAGAVSLPSGGAWLVQWLHGRVGSATPRRCVVAAVFSSAGGVGASTLSVALAVTAAGSGLAPLLIDGHPGPAGIELLLGATEPGGHWQRFAGIRGFLSPDELGSLPTLEGVRCLGWGGGAEVPLWQGALGSVITAARRDHDLVVVDAGLHAPPVEDLPRSTRPILLVPASWRGVLAARPRLATLRQAFDEPPVIVLRDVGGKADPRGWLKEFPDSRGLLLGFDAATIDDEEQGRPPGTRPRSLVSRISRAALALLAEQPAAA